MFDRISAVDADDADIRQAHPGNPARNGVDASNHPLECEIIPLRIASRDSEQERAFAAADIDFDRPRATEEGVQIEPHEIISRREFDLLCRVGHPIERLRIGRFAH